MGIKTFWVKNHCNNYNMYYNKIRKTETEKEIKINCFATFGLCILFVLI